MPAPCSFALDGRGRWRAKALAFVGTMLACSALAGRLHAADISAEPGTEVVRLQYLDLGGSGVHQASHQEAGSLSMIFRDTSVSLPVAGLGTDSIWFAGIGTRDLSLEFSGFTPTLHSLLVGELYGKYVFGGTYRQLSPDRAFLAIVAAGIFADDPNSDHGLVWGGVAVGRFRTGPTERWGLGLSAGAEFGDPLLTPLVEYAYWSSRWTANLQLPLNGDVRLWLSDEVSIGGQWLVKGGDFHVNAQGVPIDEVRVTEGSLAAVVAIGRRTGPQLELSAGRTLFRRYRVLVDGQEVNAFNFAAGDVRSAVVSWRF